MRHPPGILVVALQEGILFDAGTHSLNLDLRLGGTAPGAKIHVAAASPAEPVFAFLPGLAFLVGLGFLGSGPLFGGFLVASHPGVVVEDFLSVRVGHVGLVFESDRFGS